jgi:drug/metabolite transporter (DMT)-like permease
MKLNFWQILGIALLLLGVIVVARKQMRGPAMPPPSVSPATQSVLQ